MRYLLKGSETNKIHVVIEIITESSNINKLREGKLAKLPDVENRWTAPISVAIIKILYFRGEKYENA
ncbi:MAG: hypothetical protein J7L77_06330 [Clostridiales bacterium]|nr:hypothetical protein [Clostridiales bacterium]